MNQQQAKIVQQSMKILEEEVLYRDGPIESPSEMKDYLRLRCAHLDHEEFGVVWLDNRHRVLKIDHLFRGTIDQSAVYPREVVKQALELNAAAAVFFHNHPSGDPDPSLADAVLTEKLKDALKVVDVRTLDHIVVAKGGTVSMAERGLV